MTSDRSPPEHAEPRITVAIPDLAMRRRIHGLLARSDVEVSSIDAVERDEVLARLAEGRDEVLVVRRSQLADRFGQGGDPGDGPALVVVESEDDPQERARLLAAGVRGVVPADASSEDLARAIEQVHDAEEQGGIARPDAGGARPEPRLSDFWSRSAGMRAFLEVVERVKGSDSTLLINGETGVGKERLARAIHAESRRADGPFVSVNCGALPEQLLESELFGHVKGAFTGADIGRQGRFEQAQGGTIFLDEIGEMERHLQVKLLTVLQRREVRPIGADRPKPIDVRVMTASHHDLRDAVRDGSFREDLYYRLAVVPLRVPPLRERTEDVADLAGYFVRHLRDDLDRGHVRGFTDEALALLLRHPWPGNVRELVNAIEHGLLMCHGELIGPGDLPAAVVAGTVPADGDAPHASPTMADADAFAARYFGSPLREARAAAIADFERAYLIALLRETGGAIGDTASRAGVHVRSLHDRMKKLGLRKEDFRSVPAGDGP